MPERFNIGTYLSQKSCSPSAGLFSASDHLKCFIGLEKYDLIPFTKRYPDIENYFEERRKLYQQYKNKRQRESEAKIINL